MVLAIVVGCSVLLLLGLFLVARWGSWRLKAPATSGTQRSGNDLDDPEARNEAKLRALHRYFWWANVASFAALVSALLAGWPGGRLAMRVLAFTSPDSAQGRLTEAQANVGFPTLEGSMALLLFGGLPAGYLAAVLYAALHRWLPAGRLGGPVLGVILLLWLGAVLDPLRPDNIDFNIVGPGWLSVALFAGLSVLHGALTVAAACWFSNRLPLWSDKAARYYLPLLLGSVLFPPAAVGVGLGALLILIWMTVFPARAPARRRRFPTWAGAAAITAVSAAVLPGFIAAAVSIASRPG